MFTPVGHRVIVKRDEVQEQTSGGIIIASSESTKKLEAANCQTGVVVSIGDLAWKAFRVIDEDGIQRDGDAWVRPGDYVLFAKYAGRNVDDPFTPGEEDLIILNDEDIIARIDPVPTVIPESPAKEAKTETLE